LIVGLTIIGIYLAIVTLSISPEIESEQPDFNSQLNFGDTLRLVCTGDYNKTCPAWVMRRTSIDGEVEIIPPCSSNLNEEHIPPAGSTTLHSLEDGSLCFHGGP